MKSLEEKVRDLFKMNVSGQEVADKTGLSKSNYYILKKSLDFDKVNYGTMTKLAEFHDEKLEFEIMERDRLSYFEFLNNLNRSLEGVPEDSINENFQQVINDFLVQTIQDKSNTINLYNQYKKQVVSTNEK